MLDAERKALRRDILDDVGVILRDHFASEEWGRVLVEVVRLEGGEPAVASIDVEDIVGDEARIDAAFDAPSARPALPVLAKATEALCGLAGVELEDVRGGTFLRHGAGHEWLPGLVHAPSAPFERAWDDVVAKLEAKRRALEERFALSQHDRYDVDVESQSVVFWSKGTARVTARATLIGTYAAASRAWGWGGYNKSLPESVRAESATLVDSILERDMWELSTPTFAVDEPTAWALAALVCDRAGGEGVHCSRRESGLVFLLLRDVRAPQRL